MVGADLSPVVTATLAGMDGEGMISAFATITGHAPYPWQRRLYRTLLDGHLPDAADIATGGGKTAAVLLHLLALAEGSPLPRRIAYVVDRRAVVDQTASVIRRWLDRIGELPELVRRFDGLAAFPAAAPVVVGVLRGGLADDGEWRVDPARPAVVIGTVDMLGSRLLFSGYGNGRSRRAMDAGLLGHDTALYLDEAHLSPGFAGLIRQLRQQRSNKGPRPGFHGTTLSATHSAVGDDVLRLAGDDLDHPELRRRLHAPKSLHLDPVGDRTARLERMRELAAGLTGSVIVYVRTVKDAAALYAKLSKQMPQGHVGLLTGTLRGAERDALTDSPLWQAFQPDRSRNGQSYWLVATAAGEVGVDLDADHAVMDLTALDAMIQRFGRVNRTGRGRAEIRVVFADAEMKKALPAVVQTLGGCPTYRAAAWVQ